jgi:hypothetical protein
MDDIPALEVISVLEVIPALAVISSLGVMVAFAAGEAVGVDASCALAVWVWLFVTSATNKTNEPIKLIAMALRFCIELLLHDLYSHYWLY